MDTKKKKKMVVKMDAYCPRMQCTKEIKRQQKYVNCGETASA